MLTASDTGSRFSFRETDDVTGGSGAIIVVLGAPNDDGGRLSAVAASRCALALEQYQCSPRPVLPTGGWGAHFNTTSEPHYQYITAYLRSAEVPPEHVLPGVDSANTYDDVALVAEAARVMGAHELTVVTSDYHVARVQLLFARLAPDLVTDVLGAHAELSGEELGALEAHERAAVDRLALPLSDPGS